jgi:hypothetical protein
MDMRIVLRILAFFLLSAACAYGQMTVLHYERMRVTARATIHMLAVALQNTNGRSKMQLLDAMNNEEDIVDWANWCIVAFRDKTSDARACVFQPDVR